MGIPLFTNAAETIRNALVPSKVQEAAYDGPVELSERAVQATFSVQAGGWLNAQPFSVSKSASLVGDATDLFIDPTELKPVNSVDPAVRITGISIAVNTLGGDVGLQLTYFEEPKEFDSASQAAINYGKDSHNGGDVKFTPGSSDTNSNSPSRSLRQLRGLTLLPGEVLRINVLEFGGNNQADVFVKVRGYKVPFNTQIPE